MINRDEIYSNNSILKAIFNHSESASFILDSSGIIVLANLRAEQITGYTVHEMEGRMDWKDFILKDEQEEFNGYIQLLRANITQTTGQREISFSDKSGAIHTGIIGAFTIPEKNYIVISLVDITEQKEYQKELEKAKEEAENSERLKAAFLANMSHEIRTPINGIVGFADLLKMDELAPEKKTLYLNQVIHGSHDLLLLIEKIITISRLDSGQLKISNREFDLNSRLNDMAERLKEELINRGKTSIELSYIPGIQEKKFLITGDPIRLTEVLSNLLENAIKFTESGRIEFGYYFLNEAANDFEGESLLFYVKDSGFGINKAQKKIIFDRFVKIVDQEETLYKGAGLGLSICKEIVTLLGGSIWVESTKGSGSRFFFSYPLAKAREKQNSESAPQKNSNSDLDWSDREILIAEDIESNYLYIKELVSPTRVNILRARDGIEAVDLFNTHPNIDLVVMDILMPGMDGHEATSEIRKIRPDVPVIAQSAFTFEGDIKNGLYAGYFNDYIMKPYTRKVLLAVINKYFTEDPKS